MVFLDGCDKVPVYLHESRKVLIRRRDEGLALFTFLLLERIMEGFKIAEDGGRGRNGTMLFLSPPSFRGSPLLTGQSLRLHPAEHLTEAFILFENPDVVHTVSPGEVEQDEGKDHLLIRPSLRLFTCIWAADMISQAQDRGEIEIDGEACKGRHSCVGFLFFVLVGKNALWHTVFTSLVIGLVSHPYSIIPCIKGQRGFSLFLMVDQGPPKSTASLCPGLPES